MSWVLFFYLVIYKIKHRVKPLCTCVCTCVSLVWGQHSHSGKSLACHNSLPVFTFVSFVPLLVPDPHTHKHTHVEQHMNTRTQTHAQGHGLRSEQVCFPCRWVTFFTAKLTKKKKRSTLRLFSHAETVLVWLYPSADLHPCALLIKLWNQKQGVPPQKKTNPEIRITW